MSNVQSNAATVSANLASASNSSSNMRSYANATKKSFPPTPAAQGSNTTSSPQNGQQDSNNKSSAAMGPTIVNSGNATNGDFTKKPSVTISAAGASGHLPNGGPVTPSARPNINFGSLNEGGSSAAPTAAPQTQNTNLSAGNPRITSPTSSPSPIPQPAATSGGKPPAGLQTQGNVLNFGSIGGSDNMQSRGPPGPVGGQQLRRDGSQQSHSDMGNPGMNRGGFVPGAGRGGRGYQPNFNNQASFSPGQNFRPMPNQQRPGSNYGQHFQGQMPAHANSPHNASRAPNFQHSQPGTPQMQMGMMASQHNPYAPPFNQYAQNLNQPGQFGMQPQFDPHFGYYQAPYQMHPQYLQQQGPPQSPRQYKPSSGGAPQQFVPGQYNSGPSQNMSRSSSQISERPASVQPPQPQPAAASANLAPPASTQATPATHAASSFSIPSRAKKSAAIVIKNADGEVVTFDKKPTSTPAPPVKSPSPASAAAAAPSATSTSPRPPSSVDGKAGKTAAEIKAEFQEQVKKGQEEEKRLKEEEDDKTAKIKADEDSAVKAKEEADAQAAKDKEAEDAKAAKAREDADALVAKQKADAEAKAAEEAKAKEAADAKAKEQKDEDDKAKVEADRKADADKAEFDAAEKKRLDDEEMERMIAEMDAEMAAKEKEDEEREAKYQAEKKAKAAEKAKADAAKNDEDMRRAEREAEALEESRANQKPEDEETDEAKAEREKLFASLAKPTVGPGAEESGANSPTTEEPEQEQTPAPTSTAGKPKPPPLKIDSSKSVEPAQPTPGMQSLKSARMLQLQSETVSYPEGIQSPNPALNQNGKRNGRLYDKSFLLQFQEAFKEKPSMDWDQKLKDTVHDTPDSAGPKSARGSGMGPRAGSARGPPQGYVPMGSMGSIGAGGRTLPPGTTSLDRFNASQRGGATMSNPLAGYAPRGGAFPMGAGMGRQNSMQQVPSHGHSPRTGTSKRGQPSGRGRDDRAPSRKEQESQNKNMPLTAGADLKPLELSKSGWKPMSIVAPQAAAAPDGHMAPDMVQRKVKSNLNKMTPERFDKIADQILSIAAQSKDESDGRTLRQVIALTFEKACDEAHWASMYAKFCKRMLEEMSPDIKDENVRDKTGNQVVGGPLFRKYLLNRCQEEFERGWDINLAEQTETEGAEAVMLSEEYYIAAAAKRKGLGLVQFIGELYKLGMLSIKIMHGCVIKLLDFEGLPQESTVESFNKLLRAVGGTMESADGGSAIVKTYFDRINHILSLPNLPSRLNFMLLDLVDLRKTGWHSKDDQKGPKTIQEIRDEAAIAQQQAEMERARTSQRGGHGGGRPPAGRGDARFGGGPMAPPDYPRNQVGSDDLKRLGLKASSRQASFAGGPSTRLGPTSMFASRAASGRTGLGPPSGIMNRDDAGSRTNSQRGGKKEEEEPKTNANAFSALMDLDPSGEAVQPSPQASPMAAKVQPVAATEDTSQVDEKLADEASKEADEVVEEAKTDGDEA